MGEGLYKEGEVYLVKCICHVELYKHPLLLSLMTGVHGILHMNYII